MLVPAPRLTLRNAPAALAAFEIPREAHSAWRERSDRKKVLAFGLPAGGANRQGSLSPTIRRGAAWGSMPRPHHATPPLTCGNAVADFGMSHTILHIGGNSGAGLATARLLAARGASLVAMARPLSPLLELEVAVQAFDTAKCMTGEELRPDGGLSSLRAF